MCIWEVKKMEKEEGRERSSQEEESQEIIAGEGLIVAVTHPVESGLAGRVVDWKIRRTEKTKKRIVLEITAYN